MPFWAFVYIFRFILDATAVQAMIELGMRLPLSRTQEREADLIGVMILQRACMDGRSAAALF